MSRLKRYLSFSTIKLMYDSLILSHLQRRITCWGVEWYKIFKLQNDSLILSHLQRRITCWGVEWYKIFKLQNDSLILSHLQRRITCWGVEWYKIFKLQKRALCIMTDSKYNAHTEPLLKELDMLKVSDIFDVQCMKFWHNYVSMSLRE